MATLRELLAGVDVVAISPDADALPIAGVQDDSRQVRGGELFVALPGQTVDGHRFVPGAFERGAAAVVVERDVPAAGPRVLVRSAAKALAQIAANWHGRPGDAMRLIGITGTNGKTTCTYLAEALLAAAGATPGVIGTVAYRSPAGVKPAPFTTPTPLSLHATLREMREAGCTDVVMECSSHALALDRLEGLSFEVAAFTNLTQDHLDFHPTMDDYAEAKARLFSQRLKSAGTAVVCIDGPYGERMARAARGPVLRVSAMGKDADVRVSRATSTGQGTAISVQTPAGQLDLVSPLVGAFNVENVAVAIGLGIGLGLGLEVIVRALSMARGAPGRLELVAVPGLDVRTYVDYAHTPDALERALAALRPVTGGRLWAVFGCGGDRDRGKRPIMGRIAATKADLTVVTSDNPRSEPPGRIIAEILEGIEGTPLDVAALSASPRGYLTVEDRRAAIDLAVAHARPGDVILVAGKGHEDYQILGNVRLHFDDREELLSALAKRGGETSAAT